ncbi:hypothetical protein ACOMHN_067005 [Nucella lapillus]
MMMMDSQRLLVNTLTVLITCCLAVTWARMGDNSLPGSVDEEGVDLGEAPLSDDLFSQEAARNLAKRNNQEALWKRLHRGLSGLTRNTCGVKEGNRVALLAG